MDVRTLELWYVLVMHYNAAMQTCSLNNSTSVAYYGGSANREEETCGFLTENVWMYAP